MVQQQSALFNAYYIEGASIALEFLERFHFDKNSAISKLKIILWID